MSKSLQEILFEEISKKLGPREKPVDAIGDVLAIGPDSAYRRLRGVTKLTLDEFQTLVQTFDLSLDRIVKPQSSIVPFVRNTNQDKEDSGLTQGFFHLKNALEVVAKAEDKEISYFCMEIPVFYMIQVPELLNFKLYYWRSIESSKQEGTPLISIRDNTESEELNYTIGRIIALYSQIPSSEIIFQASLSSTLMQIIFFLESGCFQDPEDALLLFEKLRELVAHIKMQASVGQKIPFGQTEFEANGTGSFRLFHNEMIFSQNIALIRVEQHFASYLECNVLNFLQTDDPAFCRQTKDMFDMVTGKSILISSVAEKQRNKFFNQLEASIEAMKRKAQMIIDHF